MMKEKPLSQVGTKLRELFLMLAKALDVKHFDDLKIGVVEMQSSTTITVDVHGDDFGKLIGKRGVMINALKYVFERAGQRLGVKIRLILNNPKHGEIGPRPKFQPAENWDNAPIRGLVETICKVIFAAPFKVEASDSGESTSLEVIADADDIGDHRLSDLGEHLAVIVHAIGKVQGRNEVFIDLTEAKPCSQP